MDRFKSSALIGTAAIGAFLAWYGPGWIGLAPIAFVCWLLAPARCTAFFVGGAYYAVTYACLPATLVGFFHGQGVLLGYLAVGALAACLATVWAVLWSAAPSWWRPGALLLLLTIPPLGLAHLWSPLLGLAAWFPGWGAAALVVFAAALTLLRDWPRVTVVLVGLAAFVSHASSGEPGSPPGWVARDTEVTTAGLGQSTPGGMNDVRQLVEVDAMIEDAQTSGARVLVYPELHLGEVADPTLGFFGAQWRGLAGAGKTVVVGLGSQLDDMNVNLVAGYGASAFQWRQRVPALGAMWRPWDQQTHYQMRLGGAQVAEIDGHRTAIAICFEAGLLWPLLASQLARPQAYIALGNLSWGRPTNLNRQGRAAVGAWARLAGLPYLVAINN